MKLNSKKFLSVILAGALVISSCNTHTGIFSFLRKNYTKNNKNFFLNKKSIFGGLIIGLLVYISAKIAIKKWFAQTPDERPKRPTTQTGKRTFIPKIKKPKHRTVRPVTLDQALRNGQYDLAEKLIEKNEKISENKNKYLVKVIKSRLSENKKFKIIQYLVQHGADVNTTHKVRSEREFVVYGNIPREFENILGTISRMKRSESVVLTACKKGHLKIVKFLVNNGARAKLETLTQHAPENIHNSLLMFFIEKKIIENIHFYPEETAIGICEFCLTPDNSPTSQITDMLEFLIRNGTNIKDPLCIFLKMAIEESRTRTQVPYEHYQKASCDLDTSYVQKELWKKIKNFKNDPLLKQNVLRYLVKIVKGQEESEKLVDSLYKILKRLETNENQKKDLEQLEKTINQIKKLLKNVKPPVYAVQNIIEALVKVYKNYDGFVKKSELVELYEKITFNKAFINDATYNFNAANNIVMNKNNPSDNDWLMIIQDGKYRNARKFALENNITDMDGVTIIDAAKKFCKNGKILEDLVSIEFSRSANLYGMSKKDFCKHPKKQSDTFDKMLNQMIYVNLVIRQKFLPEISSQITSYIDSKSLNETIKQIHHKRKNKHYTKKNLAK